MTTSLKIFVLAVFALSVNAQRQFGSNCRNVRCASSQQCLGLYEPCKAGLIENTNCGFYATCVDLDGEVKHSERPATTSSVGDEPKPVQRESTDVSSSNTTTNSGQLYPTLPQANYPSSPQGGFYPPNQQGGYYPPNAQGGYYPSNPQGGYYPPNQQGGYYPSTPESSGNKKDSGSDSGFSSLLNLFSGGNRGSSSGSSGGPDLGSLFSILGKGNSNSASNSGSGGLDFSGLLNAFSGTGGRGTSQNTRNDFDNRNPTGQVAPMPSYGGNNAQNPNQAQDNGSSFLQTLGNFATSPLGQQLLVNALRSRGENENNAQQSRKFGGLFSENTGRTTQTESGASSKGYPTQAPYTP